MLVNVTWMRYLGFCKQKKKQITPVIFIACILDKIMQNANLQAVTIIIKLMGSLYVLCRLARAPLEIW